MKIKHAIPKIEAMQSGRGTDVPNQIIIRDVTIKMGGKNYAGDVFQSYDSIIAFRDIGGMVVLDRRYWDYSKTTGIYRNQFLGEGIADTRKAIKSGKYKLVDLNRG